MGFILKGADGSGPTNTALKNIILGKAWGHSAIEI